MGIFYIVVMLAILIIITVGLIAGVILLASGVMYAGTSVIGSQAKNFPNHSDGHPGISDDTPWGYKDIVCPKCKSPYCQFHTETRYSMPEMHTYKTSHGSKTTMTPAIPFNFKRYRCTNCGYIFY